MSHHDCRPFFIRGEILWQVIPGGAFDPCALKSYIAPFEWRRENLRGIKNMAAISRMLPNIFQRKLCFIVFSKTLRSSDNSDPFVT